MKADNLAKSLIPIFRAMVSNALIYRPYENTDDGRMCCHYCDYVDDIVGPQRHRTDCPIPLIEAWLREWDTQDG